MRERLREVAELAALLRIVLLGEQPDVVAQRQQRSKSSLGLVAAALQREVVGEPERAGEERALAGRQPVDALVSSCE